MADLEDEIVDADGLGSAAGSQLCAGSELSVVQLETKALRLPSHSWKRGEKRKGGGRFTISITCCRTISSIMLVVSTGGSAVSPETYIICLIVPISSS
jgi:hypothetical protein